MQRYRAITASTIKTPYPVIKDKTDLQLLYPDRFSGIGKFKGEHHIVTDPDVPPVVHAPRKCPIYIKNDIKKELDEMVALGAIRPTDWVSSVTYSRKSNGRWRVCLDPKDLNQAVKRSHHHTPTKRPPTSLKEAQCSQIWMPAMVIGLWF